MGRVPEPQYLEEGRVRRLAGELMEVYGLRAKVDHRVAAKSGTALLDAYDPEAGVGFELHLVDSESSADELSIAEHADLAADGAHILVADLSDLAAFGHDSFSSTFAFIATVVEFLNERTPGEDVDLAILRGHRWQTVELGKSLRAPAGAEVERGDDWLALTIDRRSTIRVEVGPSASAVVNPSRKARLSGERPRRITGLIATRGRPTTLELRLECATGGPFGVRIEQAGTPALRVENAQPLFFLPSTFDAASPFAVIIDLEPGTYTVGTAIDIRVRE
jgi:hypothetical protein